MTTERVCAIARDNDVDTGGKVTVTGKGVLVGVTVTNLSASVIYVRIYDSAVITDGTSTIVYGPLAIAPTSTQIFGAPQGLFTYQNGLSARATTVGTDADATDVGASECMVHFHHQIAVV